MTNMDVLDKYNLPTEVRVKVEKSREGYYVEFPDFPGLLTQADNQFDLFYMITDALLTHFEVPRKVAKDFSVYYFPPLKPAFIPFSILLTNSTKSDEWVVAD